MNNEREPKLDSQKIEIIKKFEQARTVLDLILAIFDPFFFYNDQKITSVSFLSNNFFDKDILSTFWRRFVEISHARLHDADFDILFSKPKNPNKSNIQAQDLLGLQLVGTWIYIYYTFEFKSQNERKNINSFIKSTEHVELSFQLLQFILNIISLIQNKSKNLNKTHRLETLSTFISFLALFINCIRILQIDQDEYKEKANKVIEVLYNEVINACKKEDKDSGKFNAVSILVDRSEKIIYELGSVLDEFSRLQKVYNKEINAFLQSKTESDSDWLKNLFAGLVTLLMNLKILRDDSHFREQ